MAYEVVMPYHLHMPSYFLETFTEYPYNKALQKITESFRVSPEDKDIIRDMKRKVVK